MQYGSSIHILPLQALCVVGLIRLFVYTHLIFDKLFFLVLVAEDDE